MQSSITTKDQQYWLMKSDMPYDIKKLQSLKDKTMIWDGVRNHEAKNNIKKMNIGDQIFFYISGVKNPAIEGIAEITKDSYPDPSAFDKKSEYFDAKSDKSNPKWFSVDVTFKKEFENPIYLSELKENNSKYPNLVLLKRARLSVSPVTEQEWNSILGLRQEEDSKIEEKNKKEEEVKTKKTRVIKTNLKAKKIESKGKIEDSDGKGSKENSKVKKNESNDDIFEKYQYKKNKNLKKINVTKD